MFFADVVSHYELPMDELSGRKLVNPSDLDSMAHGEPSVVPGVDGNALRLDVKNDYVTVAGAEHRTECFGDLDKCHMGLYNNRVVCSY